MLFNRRKLEIPTADQALAGRTEQWFTVAERHRVLDAPVVTDEVPDGFEVAVFGLGCFWGAEEIYWQLPGVWSTSVGFAGGTTPNPTYDEVCSGRTGHTEAIRIVFDPTKISYADLVKQFFEVHDPTQGMRQGNDVGTQYRSAIYLDEDELPVASASRERYQAALSAAGRGEISTEIAARGPFYYAEDYHQQYLHKVPNGYCGLGGTGVSCPVGVGVSGDAA